MRPAPEFTPARGGLDLRVVLLLALALAGGACTRKTTLIAESSDSTATTDSVTSMLRDVQSAWDANDDVHAASLTARAVYEDLRFRAPDDWRRRAEGLLDSLGVGVESAGGQGAMILNLFVRSDPGRGSWPSLYWSDGGAARYQEIEGRGMRLLAMATQAGAHDSSAATAATRAAALFSRTKGGRQEPYLMVWSRRPKEARWKIAQTLGPDSLGGFGGGEFQTPADTSVDFVARTFHTPRGWEECVTCPHVYQTHRFHWTPAGFVRAEDRDEPSTYATFVRFVDELSRSAPEAERRVTSPSLIELANQLGLGQSKGTWRIAPATEEAGADLTFIRGAQESYRVTFVPGGDDWTIASITPVSRSVE